jgi:hypothetical protein
VILNACESLARLTFPIAEYTIGIEKRSAMTRRSNLLKDFTTRLLLVVISSSLQRRELTRPHLRSSTSMDAAGDRFHINSGHERPELEATGLALEHSDALPTARFWHDSRALRVLGIGAELPGPPVSTADLLTTVEKRFGVAVSRRGMAFAIDSKSQRDTYAAISKRGTKRRVRDALIPVWRLPL